MSLWVYLLDVKKKYVLTFLYTDSAGLDLMYIVYRPDMHPCVYSP